MRKGSLLQFDLLIGQVLVRLEEPVARCCQCEGYCQLPPGDSRDERTHGEGSSSQYLAKYLFQILL